jgi:predicted metal-dependent phosphoesterase TrpH
MHEIVVNLHMHTPYSDGTGTHEDIAQAALRAGIDAVIVTDHNVYVNGPEDYYKDGDHKRIIYSPSVSQMNMPAKPKTPKHW